MSCASQLSFPGLTTLPPGLIGCEHARKILASELDVELGFGQMLHHIIHATALDDPTLEKVVVPAGPEHVEPDGGAVRFHHSHAYVFSGNSHIEVASAARSVIH